MMIKKVNFKKIYCIFAISFVYFFLEITLFRIVKPIGLQQYWFILFQNCIKSLKTKS